MPNKTKYKVKDAGKILSPRRSESEEGLGLPPYNYQSRKKMENPPPDPDIQFVGPSSSHAPQPSTSKESKETLSQKFFNFKATLKSGVINENTDDEIQILSSKAGPSHGGSTAFRAERLPLAIRQQSEQEVQITHSDSNQLKTSQATFLIGAQWQQPERRMRLGHGVVSTSTPKRNDFVKKISVDSHMIRRATKPVKKLCRYDLEEKFKFMELIKSRVSLMPSEITKPVFSRALKSPPPLIDLTLNESEISKDLVVRPKPVFSSAAALKLFKKPAILPADEEVQYVKSVPRKNTLMEELQAKNIFGNEIATLQQIADEKNATREKEIRQTLVRVKLAEEKRIEKDINFEERIRKQLSLFDIAKEEEEIPEIEEEEQLPVLSAEALAVAKKALHPVPPGEILVSGFNTDISRKDIHTLGDRNWLNDEVINFYMELIRERGALDNYPKVHVFNTFFYPKLRQSGFQLLKRWTRKVDIFSHDLIVVPIHLQVHWCMSVLDMKNKTAYYYDSMLAPNPSVLQLLMKYLEDESLDKKKVPYDTKSWKLIQDRDIPQQYNSYDCGVFACMFAEAASRRGKFLFTQDDMPDLRRRMVYEIITKKLLA